MNFNLSQIPERTTQPRTSGLTMIMDKGLSINEVHNFMSVGGPHSDVIKLRFGTSFVTPNLKQKIEAYQSYNIPLYFGGTLFEAFLVRGQFDDYVSICKDYGITYQNTYYYAELMSGGYKYDFIDFHQSREVQAVSWMKKSQILEVKDMTIPSKKRLLKKINVMMLKTVNMMKTSNMNIMIIKLKYITNNFIKTQQYIVSSKY